MKDGKYFIYEDSLTGEKYIAKDYESLKFTLYHLGFTKSEKHIRHHFNQLGVIDINEFSMTLFIENSHVVKLLSDYIEKQKY